MLTTTLTGDHKHATKRLLSVRRPLSSVRRERFAIVALTFLGLSTTLYIDLLSIAGHTLRPVQFVPWLIGIVVLFERPVGTHVSGKAARLYWLPVWYVAYLGVRHLPAGTDGITYVSKAIANLVAYWTAVSLAVSLKRSEYGYVGIMLGAVTSFCFATTGLAAFGVDSQMGSGRWQGFMPGANRFANLCLLASVTSFGMLLLEEEERAKIAWLKVGVWAVCLAGILGSGSRAALGIGAIGHGFVVWLSFFGDPRRLLRARLVAISGVVVLALALGGSSLWSHVPQRVVDFLGEGILCYDTLERDARRELHLIALEYFRDAPLLGVGMDAKRFDVCHHRYGSIETSSHSSYLHLLSVSGSIGLFLYLLLPLQLILHQLSELAHASDAASRGHLVSCVVALALLAVIGLHATMMTLGNAMHIWVIFGILAGTSMRRVQRGIGPGRNVARPVLRQRERRRPVIPVRPEFGAGS